MHGYFGTCISGQKRHGSRNRFLRRQIRRLGEYKLRWYDHVRSQQAPAQRHHLIAFVELLDAWAHDGDSADAFIPQNQGIVHLRGIDAVYFHHVAKIQRRC